MDLTVNVTDEPSFTEVVLGDIEYSLPGLNPLTPAPPNDPSIGIAKPTQI